MRYLIPLFTTISLVSSSSLSFGRFDAEFDRNDSMFQTDGDTSLHHPPSKQAIEIGIPESEVDFLSNNLIANPSDRLQELKIFEAGLKKRVRTMMSYYGPFYYRLGLDLLCGSINDYSLALLNDCFDFIDLAPELRDSKEQKIKFIKNILKFGKSQISPDSRNAFINTLSHPICHDGLKLVGDALTVKQINALISFDSGAIFENFELITKIEDFSFLTWDILRTQMGKSKLAASLDFLQIPGFLRTAPVDVFTYFMVSYYEPAIHDALILEHAKASIEAMKGLANPVIIYPVMSVMARNPQFEIPQDYVATCDFLVESIKANGFGRNQVLASIAYVQETNDLILELVHEIATIWADVHKNSHILENANFSALNKEFNSRVERPLKNLLFIKDQRENLNEILEEKSKNVDSSFKSEGMSADELFGSLRKLLQTPFDGFFRENFMHRNDLKLQTIIAAEDASNLIPLPRLKPYGNDFSGGFRLAPDADYIFSPLLRGSLLRNAFFTDAEDWRQDPEIKDLDEEAFAKKMKGKCAAIYRDSTVQLIDLIKAWEKLTENAPPVYSKGSRMVRFLQSVAIMPPPAEIEGLGPVPKKLIIDWGLFKRKAETIFKNVYFMDLAAGFHLRCALQDASESIKNALIDIEENMQSYNITGAQATFDDIQDLCGKMCTIFKSPDKVDFPARNRFMRKLEALFALFGRNLTRKQINFLGTDKNVVELLGLYGRALNRTQIANLMQNEHGQKFLASNARLLHSLVDYSILGNAKFEDLKIEEIRINGSSMVDSQKRLYFLRHRAYNIENPLLLVLSLGLNFWNQPDLLANLYAWEALNPFVLAYDPVFTQNGNLIAHMTGMEHKLTNKKSISNINLHLALIFVTKWIIAQDWHALHYHVLNAMNQDPKAEMVSSLFNDRLTPAYTEYLIKGEIPARRSLVEWISSLCDQSDSSNESSENARLLPVLARLSVVLDHSPLTSIRANFNQLPTEIGTLLATPFAAKTEVASIEIVSLVREIIFTHFPTQEMPFWQARLDILINNVQDVALTRYFLRTLPKFDAIIYMWTLKLENICIESIFRDKDLVSGPLPRLPVKTETSDRTLKKNGKKK